MNVPYRLPLWMAVSLHQISACMLTVYHRSCHGPDYSGNYVSYQLLFLTCCVHCCSSKLRKDAKVKDIYKVGRTLGTGGKSQSMHTSDLSGKDPQLVIAILL